MKIDKKFVEAVNFCEKHKWEYRRGYIFEGWEWEVTPSTRSEMREDLAARHKTLPGAVALAKASIEEVRP